MQFVTYSHYGLLLIGCAVTLAYSRMSHAIKPHRARPLRKGRVILNLAGIAG